MTNSICTDCQPNDGSAPFVCNPSRPACPYRSLQRTGQRTVADRLDVAEDFAATEARLLDEAAYAPRRRGGEGVNIELPPGTWQVEIVRPVSIYAKRVKSKRGETVTDVIVRALERYTKR